VISTGVLPLIVLRTHFGQSWWLVSTPCRSTLADIRFRKTLPGRTRRTSPTSTRTLAARLLFTPSRVVARHRACVNSADVIQVSCIAAVLPVVAIFISADVIRVGCRAAVIPVVATSDAAPTPSRSDGNSGLDGAVYTLIE
jgi:hypothetical protein